jgi:GAF domain-containing protein
LVEIVNKVDFDTDGFCSVKVIGTIEAGFNNYGRNEKRDISNDLAQKLFQYCFEYAYKLYQSTPLYVLELITDSAKQIADADCASLHFPFNPQQETYTYEVWLGSPYLRNLHLRTLRPRKGGLGEQAIIAGEPIFMPLKDDPDAFAAFNPEVYKTGIRAMAAFPLIIGDEQQSSYRVPWDRTPHTPEKGILYIAFKNYPWFTGPAMDGVRLFTSLAKDAIRQATNHLQAIHSLRQLANLHDITRLLADESEAEYLYSIAGHISNMLAADLIIIYEYDPAQQQFLANPTVLGRRERPEPHDGPGAPSGNYSPPLHFDQGKNVRGDVYATNLEELLAMYRTGAQKNECAKFIECERIKSGASILLRLGKKIVGNIFINYRRHHVFEDSEKYFISMLSSIAAIAVQNRRLNRRLLQTEQISREIK